MYSVGGVVVKELFFIYLKIPEIISFQLSQFEYLTNNRFSVRVNLIYLCFGL